MSNQETKLYLVFNGKIFPNDDVKITIALNKDMEEIIYQYNIECHKEDTSTINMHLEHAHQFLKNELLKTKADPVYKHICFYE